MILICGLISTRGFRVPRSIGQGSFSLRVASQPHQPKLTFNTIHSRSLSCESSQGIPRETVPSGSINLALRGSKQMAG